MNDAPRRRIQPLQPPEGQLDAVLARARYRRHRKASTVLTVAVVFIAGVAGGFVLDRPVTDIVAIAGLGDDDNAATSTESPTSPPTETADQAGSDDDPGRGSEVTVPVQSPAPPGVLAVHGKAVGVAGQAAAGLYIYPGIPGTDGFVPTSQPVGRTADDGSFSLSCTRTPVLLAPWPLNAAAGEAAGTATWAATFVGGVTDVRSALDAGCSRKGRVTRTIVQHGSTITGTVTFPQACDTQAMSLWLWMNNERSLSVRLKGLEDGDSYRIGGLPPGQHTIGANGRHSTVTVGGGETVPRDVAFSCDDGTPPEPLPSETPTTVPTPTTGVTPSPSESAPSQPEPSPPGFGSTPSGTASPDGKP
ncbi:MAG: hypothetical protein ACRDWY_11520 [Actinomycetes bacterium]